MPFCSDLSALIIGKIINSMKLAEGCPLLGVFRNRKFALMNRITILHFQIKMWISTKKKRPAIAQVIVGPLHERSTKMGLPWGATNTLDSEQIQGL